MKIDNFAYSDQPKNDGCLATHVQSDILYLETLDRKDYLHLDIFCYLN